jgi:hypothetical protein
LKEGIKNMKKLIYKGIVFDDFQLYNGNTGDYGDYNSESLNKFDSANVYVCPHCIKKYNLYTECGVFKEEIEKEIAETEYNGITFGSHYQDIVCGVKGCNNTNSYNCMFSTENCQLIDKEGEKNMNKKYQIKLTCYDYGNKKPYIEKIETVYNNRDEAFDVIKEYVKNELETLNDSREKIPVKDSDGHIIGYDYPFRADYDGENDCIVRFWDEDDYQEVTIYDIEELL